MRSCKNLQNHRWEANKAGRQRSLNLPDKGSCPMHRAGCGDPLLQQRPASFPPLTLHLKFQCSSTTSSVPGIADLLGRGFCSAIKRKAPALADLLDIVSEKAQ